MFIYVNETPSPFSSQSLCCCLSSRGCWLCSVFTVTVFSSADNFPCLHLSVGWFLTSLYALWPCWVEVTNVWGVLCSFSALMIWGCETCSLCPWAVYQEVDMSLAAQNMSESPQTGFLRWLRDELPVIDYHLPWFILSFRPRAWFLLAHRKLFSLSLSHGILHRQWLDFWSSVTCVSFPISSFGQFPLPGTWEFLVDSSLKYPSQAPTLNLNARWLVYDASQFANIISDHYSW